MRRNLTRSHMTIVCETCEIELVLPTPQLAADNADETDTFVAEHERHRITMRLDFG